MSTISVLAKAQQDQVRLDPFPHLIIQDALQSDHYTSLARSYPSDETIAGGQSQDRLGDNRRYSMPTWPLMLRNDVAAEWKEFLQYHTSQAFFQQVFSTFSSHWDKRVSPRMAHAAESQSAGLLYRDAASDDGVLMDARVEMNSPVLSLPSSVRGAHLDSPNRLFSALLYFRAEDDDSVGGDLQLFRWRNEPVEPIDVRELPADSVEIVTSIPYGPNQLVIFPQGINALHGVGLRHPTPHVRRYVFITAEVKEDWLISASTPSFAAEVFA